MTFEMNTIEIAKLYESQGHHEDAYQIYLKLDKQSPSSQTRAGINRMEMKIAAVSESSDTIEDFDFHDLVDEGPLDGDGDPGPKERIAHLCEKWINLIVLKHRLDRFKKIKSRLI